MLKKTASIKNFYFFAVSFLLTGLLLTYNIGLVEAHLYQGTDVLDQQTPFPEFKLPCWNEVKNPEFHSLRPYQAAPCGDSDKTLFCKNNYFFEESFSTRWSPDCEEGGSYYVCETGAGGIPIEKIYVVGGEYARWPIMGNTENVINSQGP